MRSQVGNSNRNGNIGKWEQRAMELRGDGIRPSTTLRRRVGFNVNVVGHKVATSRGRAMVIEGTARPHKKKTIPTGETGKKPVLK